MKRHLEKNNKTFQNNINRFHQRKITRVVGYTAAGDETHITKSFSNSSDKHLKPYM